MANKTLDIRWQQRFSNYKKALASLLEFTDISDPNKFEQQGLIKAFEYTYELAWTTLKDYLEHQGHHNLTGSRDTFRTAFKINLISNGESWMDMLKSRNLTSHTYNQETVDEIAEAILNTYVDLFSELKTTLSQKETES